jgi:hypothetical protein
MRWHTPGKVDRALRFMISSGRPEFLEQVWPLITHANDQVHLRALRAGRQFRPAILGPDAAKRIASLSPEVRRHVLSEIAFNSSIDGLDLLSITHFPTSHQESDFDVSETRHTAPDDDISRRKVAGAVQIAAEACELG